MAKRTSGQLPVGWSKYLGKLIVYFFGFLKMILDKATGKCIYYNRNRKQGQYNNPCEPEEYQVKYKGA